MSPQRRERRQLRSPNPEVHERLVAAATDLIREHGVPQLRVEEVATRAGLSVGTFYLYFDGKDDLFTTLVVEHTDRLRRRCQAAFAEPGSILERLARGLNAYLDFVADNERGFLYYRGAGSLPTTHGDLSSWAFAQHASDLRPLIEAGMRTGELPAQDAELTTQAMLGLMQHLAGYWLEREPRIGRDEVFRFLAAAGTRLLGIGAGGAA